MFDNLSFGECIGTIMGFGLLLRFGTMIADGFIYNVRWLFRFLKMHFQKPPKCT